MRNRNNGDHDGKKQVSANRPLSRNNPKVSCMCCFRTAYGYTIALDNWGTVSSFIMLQLLLFALLSETGNNIAIARGSESQHQANHTHLCYNFDLASRKET